MSVFNEDSNIIGRKYNNMEKKELGKGLRFILPTLFIIILFHLAHMSEYNETGLLGNVNFNLLIYAGVFCIVFLLYLIIKKLLSLLPASHLYLKLLFIIYGFFSIASFVFLYTIYETETQLYAGWEFSGFLRENVNHVVFTLFMFFLTLGIMLIIKDIQSMGQYFRTVISIQVALICAILTYAPNFFVNSSWSIDHLHAYTNSIVNVAHFAPYNDVSSSIYGHYGLIYLPFVKLLGNNMTAVCLSISLFTLITYITIFNIVNKWIKNDLYYGITVLAIAATSVTYFGAGQYFQTLPHRYLFPFITLCFLFWLMKRDIDPRETRIMETGLGVLALIFNLETGMCSLMIIAAYHVFKCQENILKKIYRIVSNLGFCMICFLLSYVIVNFYNCMAGGSMIGIGTFIYPIGSSEYDMFSILRIPLPDIFSAYILHIVLFSFVVFETICNLWKCSDDHALKKNMKLLLIAVSGLGMMAYVMNRPAATTVSVSHLHFVILLGIYGEKWLTAGKNNLLQIKENPEKLFSLSMSSIAFLLVSWFALEGIWGVGTTLNDRAKTVWNTAPLKAGMEMFVQNVPENTLAFGTGMPELYYQLGWDPGIAITDWSDMNHYSLEEVTRKVNETDAFVMMDGTAWNVPENFQPVQQIATDVFTCTYYRKSEN